MSGEPNSVRSSDRTANRQSDILGSANSSSGSTSPTSAPNRPHIDLRSPLSAADTPVIRGERVAAPTPTGSRIVEEVSNSIADIDPVAWDQVRPPEDLFLDLRLLRAVEASMAGTARFQYLLYRSESGTPLAIGVLSSFTVDIGVLADDDWSRWGLGVCRRISRWLVDYRIACCGLPLSACQSSLRFSKGADTASILRLLDRALRRLAREERASIIVLKEFTDDELPPLRDLESLGYRKADSLPAHGLPLASPSFDGYLQDVGKKKRHHIRQSMKKFSASGVELITTRDLPTIERLFTLEAYRLYEAVLGRSKTQLERLTREFFLEVARQFPDRCEFQFALEGGRVLAFCISLSYGSTYFPLFVGFDYDRNRDVDLYFNLLFRTIADATARGAAFVELGQNSEYFKRTKLGCSQTRRSIYVRGADSLMNAVIGLLFRQLFPARPLHAESAGEESSGC